MWRQAVFNLACFGLMSVIYALTTEPSDIQKLKVLCKRGDIIDGKQNTIKSICNSNYSIFAPGIFDITTDKYPLKLVSYIDDESGQQSSSVEQLINSPNDLSNKENITHLMPDGVMDLAGSACSIRGGSVRFELKSADGTLLYQAQVKRRIWCDNSAVDLKVHFTGGGAQTIYLDESVNNLKTALAGSSVEVTVESQGQQFQEFGTEEGKVQLGIFSVAFITKYRKGMPLSETECQDNVNHTIPQLTDRDNIIAFEIFKANAELPSTNLFENVKMNEDVLDICGDYVLVLLIDALNTLGNEGNRCNNFVTIRINSTKKCDSVAPSCGLIRNAWTDSEARVVFKGKRDSGIEQQRNSFTLEDERLEENYDDLPQMMFMKKAYGRLMLLRHYIESLVEKDPGLCTDLAVMVNEMEQNSDETAQTAGEGTALPESIKNVIVKLGELSDQSADTTSTRQSIENELNQLLTQTTDNLNIYEQLVHKMKTRALQKALSLIDQGTPDDFTEFCVLPSRLEEVQHSANIQEDMFALAEDIVSAFVSTHLPCFENILKRFLIFAQKVELQDVNPAFVIADQESLAVEDDLGHCAKRSECIKKLRRMCNAKDITIWQDIDEESKSEVCKMYVMKKVAKDSFMKLGMPDLYNNLNDGEDQCNRDVLKPDEAGPQTFWKEKVENGRNYIIQGMVNEDASKIAWRKKAVCSCPACTSGSVTGEPDNNVPTGDESGVMRRKRK